MAKIRLGNEFCKGKLFKNLKIRMIPVQVQRAALLARPNAFIERIDTTYGMRFRLGPPKNANSSACQTLSPEVPIATDATPTPVELAVAGGALMSRLRGVGEGEHA